MHKTKIRRSAALAALLAALTVSALGLADNGSGEFETQVKVSAEGVRLGALGGEYDVDDVRYPT
ncbi:hypothetical protein [Planomonospora venezuelensis]|uniref:Uncharacterized protein n=1 Tax=Planomonospora venezuelensis TaxID=1999 RepID=A0A841D417_PLAVE|nr:hypothetical protein [Planomonospora venezuelensis]MBB5965402.1 hypothetical protein [Planomonospora venezuelensis]GIN05172.1 hypothetical protein Pve01_68300 [Planomonospora venezuelensis]